MSDTVETFKHKGLTIKIEVDPDMENPCDMECQWKVYSFNTRHASFKEPSELGLEDGKITNPGLRQKLKVGLAFFLSYYEHGLCDWSVAGSKSYPDARWDAVGCAGMVIWEHPPSRIGVKTYEEREKDAKGFIELFTKWCNGEGYYYVVLKPCGSCGRDDKTLDSCCGYSSVEEAKEEAISAANAHVKLKKPKKKEEKATC